MVMVYVPEGEFLMGTSDADLPATYHEKPEHIVYVDDFWIDRTEVTNDQYRRCVEAGICQAPIECSLIPAEHSKPNTGYQDPSKAQHPVVCVTWYDAKIYCSWVGARLPTEAEWEKAARGPDSRTFPWGNSLPSCTTANFDGCVGDTAPVGSYPAGASAYGMLDAVGNALEWTNTQWAQPPYDASDGREASGSETVRVQRSSRYWDDVALARTTYRYGGMDVNKYNTLGFRCCMSGTAQP
jgi:formylglycine-generating enzyme required for sulfatase activity